MPTAESLSRASEARRFLTERCHRHACLTPQVWQSLLHNIGYKGGQSRKSKIILWERNQDSFHNPVLNHRNTIKKLIYPLGFCVSSEEIVPSILPGIYMR